MKTKKRFNFDSRLIFIGVSALIIIAAVITIVLLKSSAQIEYDIVYSGISGKGLIIRQESYTDLSEYEKLDFERHIDGDTVNSGDSIVTAFKKGYIKTTLDKLRETENSIVAYQNQSVISSYDDKTITKFDFDIEVTLRNMSEYNEGFIELYTRLCSLMQQREDYIKETYNTDSNTYLQQLYSDEKSLADSLAAWSEVLTAAESGVIGFYCDGFESELTPEKAMTLSGQEVKDYLKKNYESNKSAFKIVSSEKWYAVVNVKSVDGFNAGMSYPVYIGNETEYEIGVLERIIDDKKGKALVFSFETGAQKYIDFRSCDIHLGERSEGYSVKNGFVSNSTVTVKIDGKKTVVPVEVLYSDSNKTVFKVSDSLQLGQKVYK